MANASQNNVFLEYISKLGENLNSYMVLYLSLSLVSPKLLTEQMLSSLRDVFAQQIKDGNAKLFDMPNSDMAIIFNKVAKDEMLSSLVKIKLLLQEDETVSKVAYLQESPIAVFWDLVREYGAVSEKISQVYEKNSQNQAKKNTAVVSDSFFNTKPHQTGEALTTDMLDKVQRIIAVSDFSSFIRRQPICAVIGKSMPQRVFEEVYVSIPDMRDSLLPKVDLFANEWLFLALTETLDRRVLEIVSRHDDGALRGNFSLNINVNTILSDSFLHFDETIDASQRKTIMLELQLADIFSDMRSFDLAKTFARSRGYKICIDGITVDKLEYINRSKLDCDLMKITWHPDFMNIIGKDKHFMDYTNKAERAKIILCRVDDEKAVEMGNSLGINLYQGRYIQKMLNAEKR